MVSSLGLMYLYVRWIRFDAYEIIEVIVHFFCLLGLLIIDILIIKNINIPILQAILGICVIGGIVTGALNSK